MVCVPCQVREFYCAYPQRRHSKTFKALVLQGRMLLLFCWPLEVPDASATRLGHFVSDLLFSILGPTSGWMQPCLLGKSQARPNFCELQYAHGIAAHAYRPIAMLDRQDDPAHALVTVAHLARSSWENGLLS